MKNKTVISACALFLLMCLSNFSKAQSELNGHWMATCMMERMNVSSISMCSLCPSASKFLGKSLEIENIGISFIDKTIKLGNSEPVPYTWDADNYTLSFLHLQNSYNFKVMVGATVDFLVLKEVESGTIVVLKKV